MPVTFSGACSANAPVVYDTVASQATGALSTGIGIGGADGATLVPSPQRIGGQVMVVKVETDANTATP